MVDDDVGGTDLIKCSCKTNKRNHRHSHTHTHRADTPDLTADSSGSGGGRTMTPVKEMLLSLVLLSLFVSPVLSLECYVCISSATNEACNQNTQVCPAIQDICMTTVDISGSTTVITKQCATQDSCLASAASAPVDTSGNSTIVNCCNSFNLCNFSGAEAIHIHTALLLLTVGVLFLMSH